MKLTRENERMKNQVKKQIMYVMAMACLVLAFCLCPMQKTEARDWGEDYPYGEHEILKFNGKNATWNLRTRENALEWCYSIQTGPQSDTWKNVKLTTGNPYVVETFAEESRDAKNRTNVSLNLEPTNPGKTTVTLSFKNRGKNYKYKFNVIVRNYENPFERLKIGNKNIKTQYDDRPIDHGGEDREYNESASLKLEKGTHNLDIRMRKNWKLISVKNGKTDLTRSKKVKVAGKYTYLTLVVQNEKTGERLTYYVEIVSLPNTVLKLNKSQITVYVNRSAQITVISNKNPKEATWSSSNSKIATVKNGKVTGKKAGTAKITVKLGGKTATCTVIVKGYATSAKKLTKKEQHKLYENTIKSYAKSMKNGAKKWNEDTGMKTYFAFVDIDKNGTDELIVRATNSTMKQTTASTSGYGENTHIYTIKNNKVKKVLGNSTYAPTIGHLNYVHVYKNCKYIDRGFAHTPGDYIFYKYSNGTLSSKPTYTFTVGGWGAGTWMINGKNVSKNYCMKQLNKVSGNREGYPMHKYSASTYKNFL